MNARLGTLLLLALATACAQVGQIVLVVDSDIPVPDELVRIEIDVLNSRADPSRTAVDLTSATAPTLPLTLGISSRLRADADVRVEVRGYLATGEILVRDVATRLTPGSARMLRVLLAERCRSLRCLDAETCDETGCRGVEIDGDDLPDWPGSAPTLDGPACVERGEDCNFVDDDCDGVVDEMFDRLTNANHCGRCGDACESGLCTNGFCAGEAPIAITAGGAHTCVRRMNGTVACFGWNSEGALGSSLFDRVPTPLDVPLLTGVEAVAAGGAFTCVLDGRDQLQCVGDGDDGALGRASLVDGRTYAPTMSPATFGLVAAGPRHACAVESGGIARCWGESTAGEAGPVGRAVTPIAIAGVSNSTAIAVGLDHSCAVVSGSVVCWGSNMFGQLGADPVMRAASLMPIGVPVADATALALGRDFSCALRTNGRIMCWGSNATGQLGSTRATMSFMPLEVDGITDAMAITAAAGGSHACALRTGGRVTCWGANASGQLGIGTTMATAVPADIMNVTGAVAVAAGGMSADGRGHTCVVLGSGEVLCTGDGTLGQTGDALLTADRTRVATVPGLP